MTTNNTIDTDAVKVLIKQTVLESFSDAHWQAVCYRVSKVYQALIAKGFAVLVRKVYPDGPRELESVSLDKFLYLTKENLGDTDYYEVFVITSAQNKAEYVARLHNGNFTTK